MRKTRKIEGGKGNAFRVAQKNNSTSTSADRAFALGLGAKREKSPSHEIPAAHRQRGGKKKTNS